MGVNVLMTMAIIISRASNRVFVGLPLCQYPVLQILFSGTH